MRTCHPRVPSTSEAQGRTPTQRKSPRTASNAKTPLSEKRTYRRASAFCAQFGGPSDPAFSSCARCTHVRIFYPRWPHDALWCPEDAPLEGWGLFLLKGREGLPLSSRGTSSHRPLLTGRRRQTHFSFFTNLLVSLFFTHKKERIFGFEIMT